MFEIPPALPLQNHLHFAPRLAQPQESKITEEERERERERRERERDHGLRRRLQGRGCRAGFFSQDVLDSLGAPTSMARLLSLMEDVASQTGGLSSTAGAGASQLRRWVAKEDDDAVYLKVPMPGLTKDHVKARADKNILVIEGEGEKQPWDGDDDSAMPRYNRRIEVPAADAYKMDKIKAEMKNDVLWVTLLKVKEEERTDVFHVKVE
ncbi:26.2 kDa heat shock protein, mitochondrial-like [Triticum dicoccoides]|uniref:26.2 kDa heat shock protein, mitochondrial-like n=1 Tax=Triticum dicoccoides TaxID=85692 RepID=UPI001890C390|nr:26.2 kDa heat shock protein, mitochondrial-like [Triticum dicoccoides]